MRMARLVDAPASRACAGGGMGGGGEHQVIERPMHYNRWRSLERTGSGFAPEARRKKAPDVNQGLETTIERWRRQLASYIQQFWHRLAVEQQMSPSIAMFLLRCSKIMPATIFFPNAVDRQQQIAGVRADLPHLWRLIFGELQWNAR